MSIHHKSAKTELPIKKSEGMTLREFDKLVYAEFGTICGIDEAGRGPLAGDVYAAAVILDPDNPIEGLNDSKKLTEKKREGLYPQIIEKAKAYCIAHATVEEINSTDILSANLLAMKRAYEGLGMTADIVIVDGDVLPEIEGLAKTLKGGDAASEAIAAASILAKVTRDRYMVEQATLYPQYGFEKHKGYGTKAHCDAIREFGACPIHREKFLRNILNKK